MYGRTRTRFELIPATLLFSLYWKVLLNIVFFIQGLNLFQLNRFLVLFVLFFYVQINSYSHVETVLQKRTGLHNDTNSLGIEYRCDLSVLYCIQIFTISIAVTPRSFRPLYFYLKYSKTCVNGHSKIDKTKI